MLSPILKSIFPRIIGYGSLWAIYRILQNKSLKTKVKLLRVLGVTFLAYFFAITRYGPMRSRFNTLFGLRSGQLIVHVAKVKAGYEPVRELFVRNLEEGLEVSAQCVAYVRGEKVVDLHGYVQNNGLVVNDNFYNSDSLQIVYSSGKNVEAIAIAMLVDRKLLDYDQKISYYWPEFAQNGKENITIADLMRHEGGLSGFVAQVSAEQTLRKNLKENALGAIIERESASWPENTRRDYHALTRGWVLSELVRRVDPQKRTLGEFIEQEIATPLGADFYIGLQQPQLFERMHRLLKTPAIWTFLHSLLPQALGRRIVPNIFEILQDFLTMIKGESPSFNAVASALALAKIASAMAQKGRFADVQLLSEEAWQLLHEKPVCAQDYNLLNKVSKFTQGGVNVFDKDQQMGSPHYTHNDYGNVGWTGLGGSVMQWNRQYQIGFGYAMTLMDGDMSNARGLLLQNVVYECAVKESQKID